MLGDVILAEPGALIGFAGPRVIAQTIGQKLPEGFQRAEYLVEKGIIDGVVERQELKETVWKLLQKYRIPTFFFVNKMDLPGADKAAVLKELQAKLSPYCVDFTEEEELLCENVAMCEETLLETYLEEGTFDLKKEVRRPSTLLNLSSGRMIPVAMTNGVYISCFSPLIVCVDFDLLV